MGVPKFYRWTSERYPCLSQVIKEHQIPEFDNLYLDMNGIIHVCSHPNDDDPHFRITEADIFQNIFHYIEVLFRTIKPQMNFFMAVDGVAPRAKMNQQRGRRFRTAKEAEDNIKRALEKGQTLPKEERFDSNCITPGTDFMARLNEQLQYFVNMKISSDPLWKTCNVYLSGHDVPGEGEHKVMDFIRSEKAKHDYNPNIRHCLYGLDADLIMLGLVTHEPHFSLLREEVRFGKQSKRVSKPEETTFHLLHLSLMREYLDFEFSQLKETLPFKYDLERIIDDWVLLGFFVGNDFIPHMPNIHINHDAMPYLYKIYIENMPTMDGYLHDGGLLNLPRFQKFLNALAKFDREKFEDTYTDMKWLEGRAGRSFSPGKRIKNNKDKVKFSQLLAQLDDDIMSPVTNPYMALANVSDAGADAVVTSPPRALDQEKGELQLMFGDMGVKETDGGEELFEMEFRQQKRAYYTEKFDLPVADDAFIASVAFEYVLAIQWTLHYYFNGLQSWSWYYPFHYAPYISDIVNVESFDLTLDKGRPFKPFEQLLAVLPSASKKLLPVAFQSLMIMDTSPIIDYYPKSFNTDLNGKQQDWEAVVLIPFIDESRLLSAMATHYSRMTDEEQQRNSYGFCLQYNYSADVNFQMSSSFPGVFKDIDVCRARCEKINMDAFRVEIEDLQKGLCEGVKENVYFPGFPTMKHIDHNTNLHKAGVKVFQYSSKSNNMVINIEETETPDAAAMRALVGTVVHVEWPYLVEAIVTGITNGEVKYFLKESDNTVREDVMNKSKSDDAHTWMKIIKTNYLEKKGINTGDVKVLVEAKTLKGKRYVCGPKGTVTLEKEWAITHGFYAYQSIVQDLSVFTSEHHKVFDSIEDLYPVGSTCFMMASPHYACSGEVLEIDNETKRVRVALSVLPEPDLTEVISNQSYLADKYHRLDAVARKVGISTSLLSRITSGMFIRKNAKSAGPSNSYSDRVNIGLSLKFSGRNREVVGFARRAEDGWSFSEPAVDVLRSYIKRFPGVFKKLSSCREQEFYFEEDIFPGKTGKADLEDVLKFLKTLPCFKVQPVPCGSFILDERVVTAIETAVNEAKAQARISRCVKVKVKPHVLFRPTSEFGSLVADPSTDYYVFDRVVHVRDNGAVPLGYRGTIIGVHQVAEDKVAEESSANSIKYEVLFDQPFLGGLNLRCDENKGGYLSSSSLLNISYGERKECEKRGQPSPAQTRMQQKAEPKNFKKTGPSSQGYSSARGKDQSTGSAPSWRERDSSSSVSPAARQQSESARGKDQSTGSAPSWRERDSSSSGSPAARQQSESGRAGQSWRRNDKDDDDLKSPGYWLKGYGSRESADQSNQPKRPEYARTESSSVKKIEKKTADVSTPAKDSVFSDLVKILASDEKHHGNVAESKVSPDNDRQRHETGNGAMQSSYAPATKSNVNKEETAQLHKLLNLNPASQQPSAAPEARSAAGSASFTPPRPTMTILNKLFESPQSLQPRMNVPASPTSPLTAGSVLSPTADLQNWCFLNQMPAPNYTYSCTPQGIHAVVKIGPAICYGGMMCRSKPDAAESVAGVALHQLLHRQTEVEKAFSQNEQPNFGSPQMHSQAGFPLQNQRMQARPQGHDLGRHPVSPHNFASQQMSSGVGHQRPQDAFGSPFPMPHNQQPIRPPFGQRPMMQRFGQQAHQPSPNAHRPPRHMQHSPQTMMAYQMAPLQQPMGRPQQMGHPQPMGHADVNNLGQVIPNASIQGPMTTQGVSNQQNMTTEPAKIAFVPLQVNRASRGSKKTEPASTEDLLSTDVNEGASKDDDARSKPDIKDASQPDVEKDDSLSKNKDNTVNQEPASIADDKSKTRKNQKKQDNKKKVLLAPSFFAPKK